MKQRIFTLVLLLALTMFVGKVKAANETDVMIGGKYTYNLKDVYSTLAANASVSYSGGATPVQVGTTWTILANTNSTVSFEITYGSQATPATDGIITVTITNASCSNSIELDINVLPLPKFTLDLDISAYEACQERSGADNQKPDANETESNSFKFTVKPVLTDIPSGATYTYTYDITLPTAGDLTAFTALPAGGSKSRTAVADDEYTVTFTTTTGVAAQILTATLNNVITQTLTVTDQYGVVSVYTATLDGEDTQTATILPVPAIGTFN